MENDKKEIVLNETRRPDGSLATRIIKDDYKTYLVQYDRNNTVSFMTQINDYSKDKITYKDGQVATIISEESLFYGTKTITQYDEKGNITVSQSLGKNDVVNFRDGYIGSIIKYSSEHPAISAKERDELHFGPNGILVASTHQTQLTTGGVLDRTKLWATTQLTTYYPNGNINSLVTYAQRRVKLPSNNGQLPGDGGENDSLVIFNRDWLNYGVSEAVSYISSLIQYSEEGKVITTLKFNELDEVNYYPDGKVCSVLRKNKDGKPTSLTSYDQQGHIANEIVYDKNGNIQSSTDFVDGKPVSNTQQGNEQYQNIFALTKDAKSKRVIITNETRNKQGQVVTRTFDVDGKKFIDQYDSKGKVILHLDLAEKDRIVYDDEGRIKSHMITHGNLYLEFVEYDAKGKEKRHLHLKMTDEHTYATSKTKSFEKGIAKVSSGTTSKTKSFEKGIAKVSSGTKFEKALQDLFLGYLIVNVEALLESCLHDPNWEGMEHLTFPGPIASAKNNLLSSIETWKNKTSDNEEIAKMKSVVLSMDWASFAAQHKSIWHPACDRGICSYLPRLNILMLEKYKDKGWNIIEKAYTEIDRSLSVKQELLVKGPVKKERS